MGRFQLQLPGSRCYLQLPGWNHDKSGWPQPGQRHMSEVNQPWLCPFQSCEALREGSAAGFRSIPT